MPAKHSRHIALTEPLALYLENQVAAGTYASVSEVVRVAIRLLIEREEERTRGFNPTHTEAQWTKRRD